MSVDKEMPRYQCHKQVWALKIQSIESRGNGATITPEDPGYGPFEVSEEYVTKHDPKAGGYFVVYADGYQSFSPAEALEGGYTRV